MLKENFLNCKYNLTFSLLVFLLKIVYIFIIIFFINTCLYFNPIQREKINTFTCVRDAGVVND